MAFINDKLQRIDREKLEAFLDELTMLTRKYQLVVTSEGNLDVASIRAAPFEDVHRGRYESFWNIDKGGLFAYGSDDPGDSSKDPTVLQGPIEIVFTPQGELRNLIDLENL